MPGLEIDEHLRFERSEWVAERIGWCATWLFVLLALVGLVGQGPIASTTQSAGSMTVGYPRLTHMSQPMEYTLRLRPQPGDSSELLVSGDLLRSVEFTSMLPEPKAQEARADGVIALIFENPPGGAEFGVTLYAKAITPGRFEGRLEYAGDSIDLWQFAYP